ncbi:hypothetical protein [Bacillus sonorensis]|uniref:hypothetical protein n=1 Tax=Bacillus sonorensis TaxID=119858 RepID=UPI002A69AC7C|nr:hypothetical protein [Bacillus sonorensis]WPP38827.1 hypothetical protein SK061_11800 [Bacillus sonorensis]
MKVVRKTLTLLLLFGCIFTQTQFAHAVNYSNGKAAKAGDVLISDLSIDNYFVGHVAIVGQDGKSAIEVYKGRSTVKSSSLSSWLKKQSTGYYVQNIMYKGITMLASELGQPHGQVIMLEQNIIIKLYLVLP